MNTTAGLMSSTTSAISSDRARIDVESTGLGDRDVEVMDGLDAVVAGMNIVVGVLSSESIQAVRESKRRGSRSIPSINTPRFLIILAYLLFGREVLWV